MVLYNSATKELTAKVVYYGPGFCGKTTNLQLLHDRLDPKTVGNLVNLSTQTDRTIYFDLLPVELGEIKGYRIRFQLATVPGQTAFNETRKLVLQGADGIVFVVDSRWASLPKNQESWQNLKDNLKANDLSFETIPIVIQYNKRDLDDILSVEAMQEALGFSSYPSVEAVASAGRGITETFRLISKLTFVDLLRRFQGRKPEEGARHPGPLKGSGGDSPAPPAPGEGEAAPATLSPTLILVTPPRSAETASQVKPDAEPPGAEPAAKTGAGRIAAVEARLAALEAALAAESEERGRLSARLEESAASFGTRMDRGEADRRAVQQTVDASLASLSARAEKLFQEIAALSRGIETLEAGLQEKTAQGIREAEDIRSQIAPLLEERESGRETDRRVLSEIDRLRESLADSLAEVSETLRRTVGGL